MSPTFIFDLAGDRLPAKIGNKAKKLHFLIRQGFQIPTTLVCNWNAYLQYLQDQHTLIEDLRDELAQKLVTGRQYAVRSSANLEDEQDFSFAGQFKSVLGVQGVDDVLQAMWSIWSTAQSPGVQTYLEKHRLDPGELRMAVIIQEMVPSTVAGVSFSKNPMTGLDEIVIEAIEGGGKALVQEGVTPGRWVFKWGDWTLQPDTEVIDRALIYEVVQQTKAIAQAYGQAVDLEWVYDGRVIHWVQLREITSLEINLYSNAISREVFPGIIKPLVWSVNVPLVNSAWVRLFTELIGPNDIDPRSLAKSFYYRAYFNMGAIGHIFERLGMPRETLELLMGIENGGPDKPTFKPTRKTLSHLPRILWMAWGKIRFGRKLEADLPAMQAAYDTFHTARLQELSASALLNEIDRLYRRTQELAYYNIVTPLLMQIYNRALKSQLTRVGIDFAHFDLTGDMAALNAFDPNPALAELNRQYRRLATDLQYQIKNINYANLNQLPGCEPLYREIEAFIGQYGHLSDSGNDFSSVPWRENRNMVLKMVVNYVPPPHPTSDKVTFQDIKASRARRSLMKPLYQRSRQFRFYREAVSFLYTYGYGLFRDHFLALGTRLAEQDIIDTRNDIFYLYFNEVKDIVEKGAKTEYRAHIEQRKQEIDTYRQITPPSVIYGDEAIPIEPHLAGKLKGTPTSRGHYTGPARIIQGMRDFAKLQAGDVLVIPFSDVGWTPLFTKAGAVIAESGGMLSHSSIIAREYNIPAVVSVPGACQIEDNTPVTVDGYRGEIIVHEPAASS